MADCRITIIPRFNFDRKMRTSPFLRASETGSFFILYSTILNKMLNNTLNDLFKDRLNDLFDNTLCNFVLRIYYEFNDKGHRL